MRPEEIREFVRRQPFKPSRMTLTDGRTYDVAHPDMAMFGYGSVAVGLPHPGDDDPIYDRLVTMSLLHIMQIEPIASALPPSNGAV